MVYLCTHFSDNFIALTESNCRCLVMAAVSQGSVATHLRCGGTFNNSCIANFTSKKFEDR